LEKVFVSVLTLFTKFFFLIIRSIYFFYAFFNCIFDSTNILVANDLKLDSGVGVCGKDGQSVPVGVGQPSLKIDELTVGGTQV
jgi:hypothetical protein